MVHWGELAIKIAIFNSSLDNLYSEVTFTFLISVLVYFQAVIVLFVLLIINKSYSGIKHEHKTDNFLFWFLIFISNLSKISKLSIIPFCSSLCLFLNFINICPSFLFATNPNLLIPPLRVFIEGSSFFVGLNKLIFPFSNIFCFIFLSSSSFIIFLFAFSFNLLNSTKSTLC